MADMPIKELLAGATPARMLDSSMTILFPLPNPLRAGYQREIRAPCLLNSFTTPSRMRLHNCAAIGREVTHRHEGRSRRL